MREWLRRTPKFSLVGGVSAGLVVVLFVFTLAQLSTVEQRDCGQIELVKTRIRDVLNQSLQTIGTKGPPKLRAPGYEYYLSHPAELVQVRIGLEQQITQFAASRC